MTQAPPNWYPDPERPGGQRYWDGSAWTDQRLDPPSPPPPPAPVAPPTYQAPAAYQPPAASWQAAAPPPAKKKRGCLPIIGIGAGIFVLLIIILAIAGASSSKKNTSSPLNSNLGGAAPKAQYNVGETANTSGLKITVYAVKNPQPPQNALLTPTTGDHFVSVDVQVTNPGSAQVAFSSVLGFHLLDAQNHQYDEDITGAGLTPGPPDGQIAGGQSIRGFVVFDVPNGTTGLKFRAQGSLTAAGAVWVL